MADKMLLGRVWRQATSEGPPKDYLKINGVWQDHLMFAKIANEHAPQLGSTPLERTLQRRPILGQEECHGKAKEVQRGV